MAAAFERAAEEIKTAGVEASDAQKLQLYALFKQSTKGDCRSSAPSAFRPVERAKWSSWQTLSGTPQIEAKRRYVELVKTLLPDFQVIEDTTTPEPTMTLVEPRRPQQKTKRQSSWLSVLMQLLVAGAVIVFVAVKVATDFGAVKVPDETMKSLSPLLWFAVGYSIVIVLRLKCLVLQSLPWPKGLRVSTGGGRRKIRRCRRAPVESETDGFLRSHNIQVVRQEGGRKLMLKLPEDAGVFKFGDCNATIPYTVEQTADVYYRKFKEPLPDPASRLLDSIEVLEERHLDEYSAVYKRRLLRFRNEAPSLIKRFASADFVEYIEDSLLDKQNRLFYVYVKNQSFQSLGVLEDFSVYKGHSAKVHWTELHQFCRVHITSSALSFFRSKIETFISNFYCKNAPDARNYHLQRIAEEFGDPVE